jgi:class 3 adenylate cyclase
MTAPIQQTQFPEERRWSTVLFADVQGFTSLAEKLDFETVSDLIKAVWTRLDDVIRDCNGFIDKHLGDGVMAVWGAPFAGENDAEHAVEAGLALIEALAAFAQESDRSEAKNLKMRVGINTGNVLAGYIGAKNEYTVMGDTVNVASRLEQMAEPNTVLISESTFRLVRSAFKVRHLGEIAIRGKTQPLLGFTVDHKRDQTTQMRYRSEETLNTRMVAREYELQKMAALYKQARRMPNPTFVLVVGDLGIGKSRLLMEFTSQLEIDEPRIRVISARALSQTARVPFFLWKSVWQNYFGILDDDLPEIERAKFTKGIRELWGVEIDTPHSMEAAHLIGNMAGISWPNSQFLGQYQGDPNGRVKRTFELTRELLRRAATNAPSILLLDDLHWADNFSLNLLAFILQPGNDPLPLVIYAGARTEFIRKKPRWVNVSQIINLGPLPLNAEIVGMAYPDLEELPKEIMAELARRADGNPYFLEEMVRGLIKLGLATPDAKTDQAISHLRTNTPETLQAMLQARLDALPREARMVALLASVVGRVFWVGPVLAAVRSATHTGTGLLKLGPGMLDRVVQDGLRKLVQAELAFPRAGTSFSDEQEYIFKHSLLRDVAYGLLPHKYLTQYHLSVARWLVSRRDSKFQVMAATHFEKSGSLFEAARQYDHAATFAQNRGAKDEAGWLRTKAENIRLELSSK